MKNEAHVTFDGKTVTTIGIWKQKMSWGATWIMELERYTSKTGKTNSYLIYHHGGQSYPVGTFRTLKAALKTLNSFSNYTQQVA